MSETPTSSARVRAEASEAAQSAIRGEIESAILGRMTRAGGNIAQLARVRSFMSGVLGVVGTVNDIFDMGRAGFEAMTIQRRMLMRVSAAHGFGYWAFQNLNISNPLNPPNSFLVMQRELDRIDNRIANVTNNNSFSSDGGLTSADWNNIWRRGVLSSRNKMQNRLMQMAVPSSPLHRALEERLPNAVIHGQRREAIVYQYRVVIMCPRLGSPSIAAGAYFLSSLKGVQDQERAMNLRLYQRFPYNPRGVR